MKKYVKGFAVIALAALCFMATPKGRLAAVHFDDALSAGLIHIFSAGVQMFNIGTNSELDNSLRIMQSSTTANGVVTFTVVISTDGRVLVNGDKSQANPSPRSGFDIGVGNGGYYAVHFASKTSAQLAAQAPSQLGEYITNSTTGRLCVSTGTGVGQFANAVATSAIVNDQANQAPCWGLAQ